MKKLGLLALLIISNITTNTLTNTLANTLTDERLILDKYTIYEVSEITGFTIEDLLEYETQLGDYDLFESEIEKFIYTTNTYHENDYEIDNNILSNNILSNNISNRYLLINNYNNLYLIDKYNSLYKNILWNNGMWWGQNIYEYDVYTNSNVEIKYDFIGEKEYIVNIYTVYEFINGQKQYKNSDLEYQVYIKNVNTNTTLYSKSIKDGSPQSVVFSDLNPYATYNIGFVKSMDSEKLSELNILGNVNIGNLSSKYI